MINELVVITKAHIVFSFYELLWNEGESYPALTKSRIRILKHDARSIKLCWCCCLSYAPLFCGWFNDASSNSRYDIER